MGSPQGSPHALHREEQILTLKTIIGLVAIIPSGILYAVTLFVRIMIDALRDGWRKT